MVEAVLDGHGHVLQPHEEVVTTVAVAWQGQTLQPQFWLAEVWMAFTSTTLLSEQGQVLQPQDTALSLISGFTY